MPCRHRRSGIRFRDSEGREVRMERVPLVGMLRSFPGSRQRRGVPCTHRVAGFGRAKGFMVAVGMVFKAWRRKKDGVLECARQSAAPTPLWLRLDMQNSLGLREVTPLPRDQGLKALSAARNPQRGHRRSLNQWQFDLAVEFQQCAGRRMSHCMRDNPLAGL